MAPILRIVVVLYRSPLRQVRPLLDLVRAATIPANIVVSVVINKDRAPRYARMPRRRALSKQVALEVWLQDNQFGVTGAYNLVLRNAAADDLMVILDGDGRLPGSYFEELWACRDAMLSSLTFASLDLFCDGRRVSPYRLGAGVPHILAGPLPGRQLAFADGIGVINSGLAGSVAAFRELGGFSARISLDLSDVAWSLEAAKRGARLQILPTPHTHDLSMFSTGFTRRRLRKYLSASWRLAAMVGGVPTFLRLALRGVRALRWQTLWH